MADEDSQLSMYILSLLSGGNNFIAQSEEDVEPS